MTTFTWRRGETRAFDILPEDASGASTAAAYSQAQMRIADGSACVMIDGAAVALNDGTVQGDGFRFRLDDAALGPVSVGLHRVSIWLRSADGWECVTDELSMQIVEGC